MENIFKEVRSEIQFERKKNINFPAHIHEDVELIYIKHGICTAFCDGEKYTLKDGNFFLVSPYRVHRYTECEAGEYIILIMDPKRLLRYTEIYLGSVPQIPLFSAENEREKTAPTLLENALSEYLAEGFSGIVEGYLTAFFGKLLRLTIMEKPRVTHDKSLLILQYCLTHYHENITVADVAASLHLSRSYVSHLFANRFAIHFCDYINSLRLLEATALLREPDRAVTDIALLVGFSNLRTFNRAFLKQYGLTPSAYRKGERASFEKGENKA